jgi:transcriptional regulator with XRE-family HTH domain
MEPDNGVATDVLGAYIRAQRQMADLSLRQLSEMTNISNAYLSQVERGLHQPSLRILRSIADALKIPGEDLMAHVGLMGMSEKLAEPGTDTEAAIVADQHLSQDEKDVLVGLYRNFRHRHAMHDSDPQRAERRSTPVPGEGAAPRV